MDCDIQEAAQEGGIYSVLMSIAGLSGAALDVYLLS